MEGRRADRRCLLHKGRVFIGPEEQEVIDTRCSEVDLLCQQQDVLAWQKQELDSALKGIAHDMLALQQHCDKLGEEIRDARQSVEDKLPELKELEQARDDRAGRLRQGQEHLQSVQELINETRRECASIDSESEQTKQDIVSLRAQIKTSTAEVKVASKKLAVAQRVKRDLLAELAVSDQRKTSCNEQLDAANKIHRVLKDRIEQSKADTQKAEATMKEIREAILALEKMFCENVRQESNVRIECMELQQEQALSRLLPESASPLSHRSFSLSPRRNTESQKLADRVPWCDHVNTKPNRPSVKTQTSFKSEPHNHVSSPRPEDSG